MARVWFITGASRGLGLAIATAALEAGDSVAATARNPSQVASLTEAYGSERVLTLPLDVTKNDEVVQAIQSTVDKFGRIDVVVNNAGYANIDAIEHVPMENFRAQFEANFFGTVHVSKAAVPIMRNQGSGHIIQISSLGGRLGSPGLSSYQSAKWAVGGFSAVLKAETEPFGIKVTVCEPGGMKTDWAGSSMGVATIAPEYQQTIGAGLEFRKQLLPSWSEPEKVARSVVYISKVSDPPFKLLLGPDTPAYAKVLSEELARADEKWKDVTMLKV